MAEELKKKLFEYLQEVPQKKEELEQIQQQCHSEHLLRQELLTENESLKLEVSNLRAQLEFTNKLVHKSEQELKAAKDTEVKHKLELEVTTRVRDKMKDEATNIHNENRGLKKKIEQLEKEMKTECFYRESCMAKQSKMQATIETFTNQMRGLEKDFRDLERKCDSFIAIGNKSKLVLENKDHIIKQLQEKIENLSAQTISLSSEMKNLQLNENNDQTIKQDSMLEILKEWHVSMREMKNRALDSKKETENLYKTLEITQKDMKQFQEDEELAKEKVRELEAQLERARRGEQKMCTDCSVQTDLTMSIEVGCQTTDLPVETTAPAPAVDTLHQQHSDSSVGKLISKLQKERARQRLTETETQMSQSQELSELPTQLNTKLVQK